MKVGQMSSKQEMTTVGEFAPFTYGKGLPAGKRNLSGHFAVFGSNGIVGWHDTALTDGPTVVIGRKGTVGAVHYWPDPCWPIDTTYYTTGSDADLVRYRYYALGALGLADMNTHSAVPGLNRDDAHSLDLPLPSLWVQRRIAQILGTLDDKIELNRRMNRTLEEMARALYKSWFVDFGPVRAKMDGRWQRGEPLIGFPAGLYDLLPDRLVPSELGEIPEGWEVKTLDEIADFRNGLALQNFRPAENEERLPVVKIAQLRTGKADGNEWARANITQDCIINDGDVVFSWSGSLLVKIWCGGPAALNQHLFKVTSGQYPKWFYLHCTKSHLRAFQAIAAGKTTTMGHIKREHLKEAKCVVPDATLLSAVDGILAKLFSKSVSTNVESRALAVLRDSLLPKLVNGDLHLSVQAKSMDSSGEDGQH